MLVIVIPTIPVSAQLHDGYYPADDPGFVYDGSGWLTISDGGLIYTESSAAGDRVSLEVSGDQLIIYRWLWPDGGNMEICIDAICEIVSNQASETVHHSALAYRLTDSPAMVSLTNVDTAGGLIRLNAVHILADRELYSVWPGESTKTFQVINGEVFAIDRTISTGDRILLIPLILIALIQFAHLGVTLWNRR